jgi:hypothetical protein
MARPKLKIDKEAWLEAIQETGGMVTLMAPKLGISRQTIARFRDEVEWIKQAFEDVEEQTLDIANRCIQKAVVDDPKTAQWYLDRKGKQRGFGKEVKVDATMTQKAVFHIYLPDDGREAKPNGG